MSPHQASRLVRVFHTRRWRMPTATLLREFGEPALQSRNARECEWFYVTDPHIVMPGRPCTDWAFMIAVHGSGAKFDGSMQLNSCFFTEKPFRRIRWQKMLRPWKAA